MAARDKVLYKFLVDALAYKYKFPQSAYYPYGSFYVPYEPLVYKWARRILPQKYHRAYKDNAEYTKRVVLSLGKDPDLNPYTDPNTTFEEPTKVHGEFTEDLQKEQSRRIEEKRKEYQPSNETIDKKEQEKIARENAEDVERNEIEPGVAEPNVAAPVSIPTATPTIHTEIERGKIYTKSNGSPDPFSDPDFPKHMSPQDEAYRLKEFAQKYPEKAVRYAKSFPKLGAYLPVTVRVTPPQVFDEYEQAMRIEKAREVHGTNELRFVPQEPYLEEEKSRTEALQPPQPSQSPQETPQQPPETPRIPSQRRLNLPNIRQWARSTQSQGISTGRNIASTVSRLARGDLATQTRIGVQRVSSRVLSPQTLSGFVNSLRSGVGALVRGGIAAAEGLMSAMSAVGAASFSATPFIIGVVVIGVVFLLFWLLETSSTCLPFMSQCGAKGGDFPSTANPGLPSDLSVIKSGPAAVNNGQNIQYTITITYNGTDSMEVELIDQVPDNTVFVDAPDGGIAAPSGPGTATVTWPKFTLSTGQSKSFTLTVSPTKNDVWVVNSAEALGTKISTSQPPNSNTCGGIYTLNNPLGNFGDPSCDFTKDKLYQLLQQLDPANADYWFFTVVSCESGYNPNSYNAISTSGSAWGLFQMGHEAYPSLGITKQMNNQYDRGDVIWTLQTSNAVNYNNILAASGKAWRYWSCAMSRW